MPDSSSNFRYVVLFHQMPEASERSSHWDLMLETDDVLRTWALVSQPSNSTQHPIIADALPDHRKAYLTYEGEVSNDRGIVTRWDEGSYEIFEGTHLEEKKLENSGSRIRFRLEGKELRGVFQLEKDNGTDQRWIFSFLSD